MAATLSLMSWLQTVSVKCGVLATSESNTTLLFTAYLRALDLSSNDIGEHGAVALAKGLQRNSSVEKVILRGNRIGLAGASGLARVILKHPRLQVLDVCNNDLRVHGAQELMTALQHRQASRARQIAAQASHALDRAVAEAEVQGGPGARTEAGKALNHTANRMLASIVPEVEVRYSGNFVSWEVYNSIIHGIGLALALFGSVPLLTRARGSGHLGHFISTCAYVCGIAGFFLSSTLGHSLFFMESTTTFLRQMDKLSIFVLVAGTYSPFMSVNFSHLWWSRIFLLYIWAIAVLGVLLASSIKSSEWSARVLRITMYFVIGWSALLPLSLGWACFHTEGLVLLFVGGCIYSLGVLFYLRERLFPNQLQGLWYWLVLLASAMHFAAVFSHVAPMPLCGALDPAPMFPSNSAVVSLASWFGVRSWFDSPNSDMATAVTHACRSSLLLLYENFGVALEPVAQAVQSCAESTAQVCSELPMPTVMQAWRGLASAGTHMEAIGRDVSLQSLCAHWNGSSWIDLEHISPVDASSGLYAHPALSLDSSPVWSSLLSIWYGKQRV